MLGEFDSRKDLHSTTFKQRPLILVKLSFREFCGVNITGLPPFGDMAISSS